MWVSTINFILFCLRKVRMAALFVAVILNLSFSVPSVLLSLAEGVKFPENMNCCCFSFLTALPFRGAAF